MSGFLTPDARLRVFTDLGVFIPGAKLFTYVSGTPSTPLATFSDVALTVPNANPVVASAGGLFPAIYLQPALAYKFVLTDATGAPTALGNVIWSQDPVPAPGVSGGPFSANAVLLGTGTNSIGVGGVGTVGQVFTSNGVGADPTFQTSSALSNQTFAGGRLTLTTLVPVTTADVLAATTLRYTPYTSALISLYSGAAWAIFTFAELSIAVPATTSQLYDVFVYDNAGTRTLELLAWTNDTTRATALVVQDGVLCKTGALTRRYVGSFRTTTVSGQTEDSIAKRYVWNYNNRVPRICRVLEATASWVYSTLTWRQMRATATNQLDVVVGVAEVPISVTALATASSTVADNVFVAIGEDSTTTVSPNCVFGFIATGASGSRAAPSATLQVYPAVGRHVYVPLEQAGGAGTMTWIGASSGATAAQSGIVGRLDG